MSDKTTIEWTDATWNPVTGCTKVSPGCDHCYAETFAERFRGTPGHYFENGFDVQLRPDKLDQPLRWTKPRRIFVNSMSDLFHDQVPDEYIAQVFAVMALAPQHTFQILTKRHGRMRSLLSSPTFWHLVAAQGREHFAGDQQGWLAVGAMLSGRPLPNVWLGVSVENQKWADIRGAALRQTPAAVRFFSAEPLLGPVVTDLGDIDWVIVGGESGSKARPMHPDWARSLRDQCHVAGVPFLFKQWGEWAPPASEPSDGEAARLKAICVQLEGQITPWDQEPYGTPAATMTRPGKKAAGREIDGRTWDGFPGAPGSGIKHLANPDPARIRAIPVTHGSEA